MEETVSKIAEAERYRKEHNLNYQIEVDGGINDQTIKTAKTAGATLQSPVRTSFPKIRLKNRLKS